MPPIPPPPPLPKARFAQSPQQAPKAAPTLDVFEPAQDKNGQLVIHIRSLEEENAKLKARLQELEAKSSSRHHHHRHRHHHHHKHRHTAEHFEKKRASVLEELALVREALSANQVKYEELILVADDAEQVANKAMEMGKSVLLAKMALQKQANDFERETLRQNRTRYNELLHQLGPLALKLAPHTSAPHNTLVANAAQALQMDADIGPFKEALSPTHYNKERAYAILEVKLLKFLETQRPSSLCAEEWELYLSTREQTPSRDILKRYGIQFKTLLTDLMAEVERRPGFRAESAPGLKMLQL